MTVPLNVSAPELVYDSDGAVTDSNRSDREAVNLQLAAYESSAWVHKYLDAEDNPQTYDGESGYVDWKCFAFTVTYDLSGISVDGDATPAEVFDANHKSSETFKIAVSKTQIADTEDEDNDGDTEELIADAENVGKFMATTTTPNGAYNGTQTLTIASITLGATHDAFQTFYIYVYADGASHAKTNETPNANFTVTLSVVD